MDTCCSQVSHRVWVGEDTLTGCGNLSAIPANRVAGSVKLETVLAGEPEGGTIDSSEVCRVLAAVCFRVIANITPGGRDYKTSWRYQ